MGEQRLGGELRVEARWILEGKNYRAFGARANPMNGISHLHIQLSPTLGRTWAERWEDTWNPNQELEMKLEGQRR